MPQIAIEQTLVKTTPQVYQQIERKTADNIIKLLISIFWISFN